MYVTIYAGSSHGNQFAFAREARQFARELVGFGIGIVYGGGSVGLMGVVADAALDEGGTVTGVIPRSLVDAEIAHTSLTRLHVVESMSERKEIMASLGDCFVVLPGGLGTLEEMFEVWSSLILGQHSKPIMLLNIDGYWDVLLELTTHMVDAGFIGTEESRALIPIAGAAELLHRLSLWEPPMPRWPSPSSAV